MIDIPTYKRVVDEFNNSPARVRRVGSILENKVRIQQMKFEKDRLKNVYRNQVRALNDLIAEAERRMRGQLKSFDKEFNDA